MDVQRLTTEYKKDIGDILQELQTEINQLGLNNGVTDSASEFTGSMMVRFFGMCSDKYYTIDLLVMDFTTPC